MGGPRVVLDTNVFVGALIGREGHNRRLLRACLQRKVHPLMGHTLFLEHSDVLERESTFARSPLAPQERRDLFQAYLHVCEWVRVYYTWRPNLPDEDDNHIIELAVAGSAAAIVTNNVSDFTRGELQFDVPFLTPAQFLKEIL